MFYVFGVVVRHQAWEMVFAGDPVSLARDKIVLMGPLKFCSPLQKSAAGNYYKCTRELIVQSHDDRGVGALIVLGM